MKFNPFHALIFYMPHEKRKSRISVYVGYSARQVTWMGLIGIHCYHKALDPVNVFLYLMKRENLEFLFLWDIEWDKWHEWV